MSLSPLFDDLIVAFRYLPGVGPRTASRMAMFSLQSEPEKARYLADILISAIDRIHPCQFCKIPTEDLTCRFCSDPKREDSLLCVVSSPSDVIAIEQSKLFMGRYFLLDGLLSPIDGRGAPEIGIPQLAERLVSGKVKEVVLALASSVEGEVTTNQLLSLIPEYISVSRLAQGVPIGGELDTLDQTTLKHAFLSRTKIL